MIVLLFGPNNVQLEPNVFRQRLVKVALDIWIIDEFQCRMVTMKKFMALYLAPVSALEQMAKSTPEQRKAGMDLWMKWAEKHKKAITELGAPLGKTKRVTGDGISVGKNEITGYSIVQTDSHESAAKLFEGHPHFHVPGASIEVMEMVSMPGM